ncbi:MAG: hypothetical protein KAT12_01805 [Gammaproteobacteria bacterium]|nr:hypothetical protein [Gammaproteobacteria bacterium]
MKKILLTALSLVSTSALAHTGHLPNGDIHGFLHVEHIITLVAIGFIVYFAGVFRK